MYSYNELQKWQKVLSELSYLVLLRAIFNRYTRHNTTKITLTFGGNRAC